MDFPVFKNKPRATPLFHAADFLAYTGQKAGKVTSMPEGVVICYQNPLIAYIRSHYHITRITGVPLNLFTLDDSGGRVGFLDQAGFGAPAAAVSLELLTASGITHFISMGTAGSLQKALKYGAIVLCEKALRDEGTSYHYQPPARFALPDKELFMGLKKQLEFDKVPFHTGPGWTTDAVFRESVEEVRQYMEEGILTVDMEASALFSIAEYRKVALTAAFVISDDLSGLTWKPAFFSNPVKKGLQTLFDASVRVLADGGGTIKKV